MEPKRLLQVILFVTAVAQTFALVGVFMPTEWMATAHQMLGLGSFPRAPIMEYLTRSFSALFALHAGVLYYLASDLQRYRPLVRYSGWAYVVFGVLVQGAVIHGGLPMMWVISEGPGTIMLGAFIVWLERKLPLEEKITSVAR